MIPSRYSSTEKNQGPKVINNADVPIMDFEDPDYLPLPQYQAKINESLDKRKQRLIYQSRKRGMLENDLLLSTFAARYLKDMNAKQTEQYDQLINGVTNDWDIYYWATSVRETPEEYNNEIMDMLKRHTRNEKKESRVRMPDL